MKARCYGDQVRKSLVRHIFPIPSRWKVVSARSAPTLFWLRPWQRSRGEESRRVFLALRPMQLKTDGNSRWEWAGGRRQSPSCKLRVSHNRKHARQAAEKAIQFSNDSMIKGQAECKQN